MRAGTVLPMLSAPVESTMRSPSKSKPGMATGLEPVATTNFSALYALPATSTVCGSLKCASPSSRVILLPLKSMPTPLVCFLTTASFQLSTAPRSILGLPKSTPKALAALAPRNSDAT